MLSNIPRHRRDYFKNVVIPNEKVTINDQFNNTLVYLPLIDTVPVGSVNCSVDSINYIINSSSLKLTNGYIPLENISINKQWTVECFLRLNGNNPLFSIVNSSETVFSIRYHNNFLEITKSIGSSSEETRKIAATLPINTWFYFALVRNYNKLSLFINHELVSEIENYYYALNSSSTAAYIGKINSSNATFNISNFRVTDTVVYPSALSLSGNTDSYKSKLHEPNNKNIFNDYKLIEFSDVDTFNSAVSIPNKGLNGTDKTKYEHYYDQWKILPVEDNYSLTNTKGLLVFSDEIHPKQFTLQCRFKINSGFSNNVVIIANWSQNNQKYFYFLYNYSTETLKFIYFKSNSTFTVDLGTLHLDYWNTIAIQTKENTTELFLNGTKTNVLSVLLQPFSIKYKFNYNIDNNNNSDNILYLKSFSLFEKDVLNNNYLPFDYFNGFKTQSLIKNIINYHSNELLFNNSFKDKINFELSGSDNLVPNTTNTYTINQKGIRNYPVTYTVSIVVNQGNEFNNLDLVLSTTTVVVAAGSTTNTFTLTSANFSYNKYRNKFRLYTTNKDDINYLEITINDTRSISLSTITSISGYLNGFFSVDSEVEGVLPDLENNLTAITSADKINSDSYGTVYEFDINNYLLLPDSYNNVKTLFLVYKELENTAYRTYAGNLDTYTFNGGENYELVGGINTGQNLLKVFSIDSKTSSFNINKQETTIVYINEATSKVYVLEIDPVVKWDINNKIEINTGLTGFGYLQNAAISVNRAGTAFVLGMKNANNGEGVVQIWKKSGSSWVKDLQLGSPISSPYLGGFGYSVAISEDAETLFSSEIYSNSVYLFKKVSGLWSAVPTETFTQTGNFGYKIQTNSDGTELIAVSLNSATAYIYKNTGSWVLDETLTNITNIKVNDNHTYLVSSSVLNKEVNIYHKVSENWTLVKNIVSSNNSFGYAIDIDNNNTVAVSTPYEKTISLYREEDSWNSSIDISEASNNYGYSIVSTDYGVLISNYNSTIDFYSNNPESVSQPIVKVRQNYANSNLNSLLNTDNIQILSFYSSVGLNIDRVGYGKSETGLNGLFMGCLLFNRVLTNSEILTVENFIKRYLSLDEFSLIL